MLKKLIRTSTVLALLFCAVLPNEILAQKNER